MKIQIILGAAFSVMASAALAEVPGPLITPEWLAANGDSVVVLDVRKDAATFMDAGHIPGAILVEYGQINMDMDVDGVTLKQMVPSGDAFSTLMQASGVSNDSSVVIVGGGNSTDDVTLTTRLYWVLNYYGHEDVAILNGGTAAWVADERDLSEDFSDDTPGTFVASAPHDEIRATTAEVAMASESGSAGIYDARGLDQYIGLRHKEGFVLEAGHIPGATLASSSIFLMKSGPKAFEDSTKVIAALKALGNEGDTIAYCNSGQYSSTLWFLMHEVAGNDAARLYDGSMHAWTQTGQKVVQ